MDIKDPNYMMLMMRIYGTLEHLEGSDTQQRYKGESGELVTKRFNCCEVFGNHFNYRHQVDSKNNWLHSTFSVDSTWVTNYWINCFHTYFLVLTEVNENYLRG